MALRDLQVLAHVNTIDVQGHPLPVPAGGNELLCEVPSVVGH